VGTPFILISPCTRLGNLPVPFMGIARIVGTRFTVCPLGIASSRNLLPVM